MNGTPLIVRTIKNLLETKIFDRVIVSTDSPIIKDISVRAGAEVPYLRSNALSDDLTPTLPVIKDAIETLGLVQSTQQLVICCVYPAAFMVSTENFIKAFKISEALTDGQFCVSILEYPHPVQRSFMLNSEMKLIPAAVEALEMRTQDLPKSFHDAGQFYFALANTWLSADKILGSECIGLKLPRFEVVDIDTEEDWNFAEMISRSI